MTSRRPSERLAAYPRSERLEFDLERAETWSRIPLDVDLVWCFPAAPAARVASFMAACAPRGRVVVLGSTSAYLLEEAHPGSPVIDETWPLDLDRPRVQGEELLRTRYGAVVLRLAGIYGPGRNPLDWLRSGRIRCSDRPVNLVHVEDVAQVCLHALRHASGGEAYNVSDGRARAWSEICGTAQVRWHTPCPGPDAGERPGKRISAEKLLADLGYRLRHPDLYAALEALERER